MSDASNKEPIIGEKFLGWRFEEANEKYLEMQDDKAQIIALRARIAELEAEAESCHNEIDKVLDNRFADVDDGLVESSLQHRLWELCSLYKDLQNEYEGCSIPIYELFDLIDCLKQLLNKGNNNE